MNIKLILSIVFTSLTFISCNETFLGPDPENTPESNFEILWQDFDQNYAAFDTRHVNWDSLYSVYRPKVNSGTTGRELFNIMSGMLEHFKDGHTDLITPLGTFSYDFAGLDGHRRNFTGISNIAMKYLKSFSTNRTIAYGKLSDETGYIFIGSFSSESEDTYNYIDNAISAFSGFKGIIVDVRENGGGSSNNSNICASRFADQKRLYEYVKFKTGPAHNDFTSLRAGYIEQGGNRQFTGPVALLTDRGTYSAAEDFVLSMTVFPHVTIIGDTTGGGFGNPVYRELPNGWKYRVPRGISYDAEKKCYDGIGYPPDIPVQISKDELNAGRDVILEKAVEFLKAGK